jgi:hypothetical protein
MGIICPCGVRVGAFARNQKVTFEGVMGPVRGNLTYKADVCVTKLSASTLSLQFEDTREMGNRSFTFNSTTIRDVTCCREGQNCEVTVTGRGKIGMMQYDFVAVFRDQVASANADIIQSFVITNFFDQNGVVKVPEGSIVALGCQDA